MKRSVEKLKQYYKNGNIKSIAKELPHLRDRKDKFIQFLMNSNILRMQDRLDSPPITLGADPEFILHEKGDKSKIVLFSSQYTTDYFGISEAEIGADYGLLEFRPEPVCTPRELVNAIQDIHEEFSEVYVDFEILEKEAVIYNHKRARILEALYKDKSINYGMNRGKDVGVWASNAEITLGMETGLTLSAYDNPLFSQFDDKLFTAGGHIHIGGSLVMMLSTNQLKTLVRKLDKKVLPICKSVETAAGKLRRTVYGSPGEFRLKNYGIEYRSPSNAIFWKNNFSTLLKVLKEICLIVKNIAMSS